jgi:hypothetical protein
VQRRLYQPHIWILGLGTCLASVFKTVIVDEDVAKSGISLRDEPLAAAPEVLRWSIRRIFTLSYSVPLGFLTIALPRDFVVTEDVLIAPSSEWFALPETRRLARVEDGGQIRPAATSLILCKIGFGRF